MLWKGRFSKELNQDVNDFNSSLPFDKRLYYEDIIGSIAHVTMLGDCNIIDKEESNKIIDELNNILKDIDSDKLEIKDAEDIHSFIEQELTKRLGTLGKKLHTARSRNDQVALDLRLYVKKEINNIKKYLKELLLVLNKLCLEHENTIMSGYTHLQKAQPISLAIHLDAYVQMFKRDITRLDDCYNRMNESPLGAGALAGTTHPISQEETSSLLGFNKPMINTMDAVSDRDYCLELASAINIIMMHLSRFSEEIVLWCSNEFKYIELDDAFATGSSIMPQKKNPDIAELVRGKTGRVYGNSIALLTMLKALPLAYNKDMQEDKEAIFDSIDTVKICLKTFIPMLSSMKVLKDNMKEAAHKGFINATDVADYLAKKGVPFREAYQIVGKLVAYCLEQDLDFSTLPLNKYQEVSSFFEDDIYQEISLENCFNKRNLNKNWLDNNNK
ncbi:MAG: argininosuccinate lyase [Bacilli bacterium]|jgi:argininosuccinate lyase|nr:argininosuccinate lyase [Bacilli bacterium]